MLKSYTVPTHLSRHTLKSAKKRFWKQISTHLSRPPAEGGRFWRKTTISLRKIIDFGLKTCTHLTRHTLKCNVKYLTPLKPEFFVKKWRFKRIFSKSSKLCEFLELTANISTVFYSDAGKLKNTLLAPNFWKYVPPTYLLPLDNISKKYLTDYSRIQSKLKQPFDCVGSVLASQVHWCCRGVGGR